MKRVAKPKRKKAVRAGHASGGSAKAAGIMVSELMRKDFFYLDGEERLDAVIEKFAKYGVHEAPVLSKGELKGLVSDRELAEAMLERSMVPWKKRKLLPIEKLRALKASQIMKKKVLVLEPEMRLVDAVKDMVNRETNIIPVVDKGKVVGMVTGKDVISYIAKNIVCSDFGEVCWKKGMESTVDSVLGIVNRGKPISSTQVAKELGIRTERVEEIARSLARHGLIEVRYTIAGRMELRVVE